MPASGTAALEGAARVTPSAVIGHQYTVTVEADRHFLFVSRIQFFFLQSWLLGFPVKVTGKDFHEESGRVC